MALQTISWDTTLLMLPFLTLMGLALFGLDERFASSSRRRPRRTFCGPDAKERLVVPDPDGLLEALPTPPQRCK